MERLERKLARLCLILTFFQRNAVRGVVLRRPSGSLVCGSTIVIDDGSRDITVEGAVRRGNEEDFGVCSFPYGYDVRFSTSEEESRAIYAPLLPKRGCYLLEEWHPRVDCRVLPGIGSTEQVEPVPQEQDPWTGYWWKETNEKRNSYSTCLSSRVQLNVRGADNMERETFINQQVGGANWNPVLQMMFDTAGTEIILSSKDSRCDNNACSSSLDPNCRRAQQACYWFADAFRLVYIGGSCPSIPWPEDGWLGECSVIGVNQGVQMASYYDYSFVNMPDQMMINSCNPEDGTFSDGDSSATVPQEVLLWILVALGSGGILLFAAYAMYAAASSRFGFEMRPSSMRHPERVGVNQHGGDNGSASDDSASQSASKPVNYALVLEPDGATHMIAIELEEEAGEEPPLMDGSTKVVEEEAGEEPPLMDGSTAVVQEDATRTADISIDVDRISDPGERPDMLPHTHPSPLPGESSSHGMEALSEVPISTMDFVPMSSPREPERNE